MALDSILLNPIIPPPAKSAAPQAPSPIDPGSTNGFGNAARLTNSTDTADTAGSSGGPAANRGAGSNGSTTADAAKRSSSGSSSSSSTDTRRPTRSSSTSGSSSSNSSSASSSSGAKTPSGKARDNGSPRDKTDSAQRGSRTQRGIASAAGIEQGQSTGPTFLQALAQSQAEAQAPDANTDTAAAATAEQGPSGKPKSTHDAPQDASASLAFLPQSLAAAMAGAQGAAQPQPTAQASTDASTTEAIPGSGGSATRAVLASLEKGAEDLKATAGAADGVQGTAQTSTTPAGATTPDGTNAAAIAFQAHMSVSSHFQQPSTEVNAHKVEAPVGTPAFTDEVGGKITWLANQGVQSASLQLSPEHLGPVNVHISVQDGSATVSFNAAHVDTRTALEQALPRLREMFSTQGLTLTDASVSHQSPRGQHQKQAISSINSIGGVSDDSNATSITSVASTRLGLVDTYV